MSVWDWSELPGRDGIVRTWQAGTVDDRAHLVVRHLGVSSVGCGLPSLGGRVWDVSGRERCWLCARLDARGWPML